MINKITVTNFVGNKIELDLRSPEKSGLLIKSITGLGTPKADINTCTVSTGDGVQFNSARLQKRNIVFTICPLFHPTVEEARLLIYKYFPIKKKVTLLFETDVRTVSIEGYVESNEATIFNKQASNQVSILCPNPYFYLAENDGLQVTTFSGHDPNFEFPFENESLADPTLELGIVRIKREETVYYMGDADVGATFRLHCLGRVEDINIYNSFTREHMHIDTNKIESLTGSGLKAKDDVIICTVIGKKSVTLLREGHEYNILHCIDKHSDWFTLTKGDNVFLYTAEYGDTNLQFRVENQVAYEGI